VLALAVFFLKMAEEYSRVWFGGWFLAGLAVLVRPARPDVPT
jgi:hypothetical protein